MIKYVVAMFMVGVLGVSSAFAGNCHNNVQQVVVERQVQHYVQPVRQQFVEVVDNHHYHNQAVVQRVVVANNHHHNNVQAVRVQKVVVNNNHRNAVRVEKVVVRNDRQFFSRNNNGRSVQRSVTVIR